MPNWCYNEIVLTGPKEALLSFKSNYLKLDSENNYYFKLSHTFPMPGELKNTISGSVELKFINQWDYDNAKRNNEPLPELIPCNNYTNEQKKELKEKYGFHNWYDWSIYNWGTKWDTKSESILIEEDSIEIYIDTAWSPPEEWFKHLKQLLPDLEIRLFYTLEEELDEDYGDEMLYDNEL